MPENLKDWIQEEYVAPEKPPLYRSKHDPKASVSYSTFGKQTSPYDYGVPSKAKKPAVPRRGERPVYGLKTEKNYQTANAVEVILAVPKKYPGPAPRFTDKPDYGKVPAYLTDIKHIIAEEKQIIEDYLKESKKPTGEEPYYDDLPEADRADLLRKLKRKWAHLNGQYQQILGAESRSKRKLKERYENQLTEVENDIKLLQRGPVRILVNGDE